MLQHFIHVQYCYDYLVNQIPMGLLLYSHVPTALAALLFSTFVLINSRTLPSLLLFMLCFTFGIWSASDLSAWFSFLGSANTMFTWSLLDFLAVLMFFFGYYFLYTFITRRDPPLWQKIVGLVAVAPSAVIAVTGLNLTGYGLDSCEAFENGSYTIFTYCAEGFFILASFALVIYQFRRSKERLARRQVLLAGIGILALLIFFFSASLLVSILADSDASLYAYNYLIYGLFGMPIFLIYLGYLIVKYHAFDLRIFGVQALVAALIALIGSEFAFVTSATNRVLVAITLALTGIVGIILIRNVRREIEQREHIELLARNLESANKQQVTLIHFITHQLKGFVAKSRNIFAMIQEGDYGEVPEPMKPMIDEGFRSSTKGAQTIQEILNASNIKSGTIAYQMEQFDIRKTIDSIVATLKPNANAKGVQLTLHEPASPVLMTGDAMQLENAIRNLVDNTIKYTPSGSIALTLTAEKEGIRFTTEDTGVGITAEDMKHLFTEGGHGMESTKVNVDSTGFGLYIVKNIIVAHGGTVHAESEGSGKGSRFIVTLPFNPPASPAST